MFFPTLISVSFGRCRLLGIVNRLVNVPDADFAPELATFLSAKVLVAPGLARPARARLVQSLIPIAVADRTATNTLVARLLLASPPASEDIRRKLPHALPDIEQEASLIAEA